MASGTSAATLLMHCPDRRGVVAAVAEFLRDHGANILDLDEHVDERAGTFLMRVAWDLSRFAISSDEIEGRFRDEVARHFDMTFTLHFSDEVPRLAIFVSKRGHCLYDLLSRWQSGEWRVEIPLVVSNHDTLEPVALQFGVEFRHVPVPRDEEGKAAAERTQLRLLAGHGVELVVLARYMQIVGPELIAAFPNRIINIHHSFLPAFAGARPYHAAHERGVKIIGATSHFVTEELDAGPIIEQDVVHVTHHDDVADLVRKGRDLEKVVLARAVWLYLRRRLLVCGNRTVVFR